MEWYIFIEFGMLVAFLVYWVISSTRMENRIDELENEKRTWKRIREAERKRIREAERKTDEASRNALIKKWSDYAEATTPKIVTKLAVSSKENLNITKVIVPSEKELDAMTDRQFLDLIERYIKDCNNDIAKTEFNDTRKHEYIRSQYMVPLAWAYASRAGWFDNWEAISDKENNT